MTSCPFYNNSNLDGTGGKMDNPYALIQRAGKYKKNKNKKKSKSSKRLNKSRRNVK